MSRQDNCDGRGVAQRAINLVVSCTNRKKLQPPPGLSVHEFVSYNLEGRLDRWIENLNRIQAQELCAKEMYSGDHWSVTRSIPPECAVGDLSVNLWVCSAGYGLISAETRIKPYRATFTSGQLDFIGLGLGPDDLASARRRWWHRVCESSLEHPVGPRSFSDLAVQASEVPMLVVLSGDYLEAVQDDLLRVISLDYFKRHLSIISSGTPNDHPLWKDHLLPSSADLAGTVGGALTSLNIRVARLLLGSLDGAEPDHATLMRLCAAIERKPLVIPVRKEMTDHEVAVFIRLRLKKHPEMSRTPMLTALRESGHACEQRRFGRIFTLVVGEHQRSLDE